MTAFCQAQADGDFDVYAPRGYDDIERMTIRPNLCPNFAAERYEEKSKRWKQVWPELTIFPAKSN